MITTTALCVFPFIIFTSFVLPSVAWIVTYCDSFSRAILPGEGGEDLKERRPREDWHLGGGVCPGVHGLPGRGVPRVQLLHI